ncbi:MAG: hypothetical protein A2754_02550 [Candidatus Magasanikbacteria bacterium RIFCSPHIGHO2_01_FULL_47_8]|uniref:Uncharacterized protein n=1 Tax=Candidatus Magasanikbacteria bacterium RIFCSPHIGHO2_01_FULL_47_8 TaxID=1798673 RepID=A0A1F6MBU9_9BACT|nr:MAG: hypothetical protein A2754_02550 [Candidatus Magasanikbacteria bacterium RIFCSPHIGHO2_01_FULL_47_8]
MRSPGRESNQGAVGKGFPHIAEEGIWKPEGFHKRSEERASSETSRFASLTSIQKSANIQPIKPKPKQEKNNGTKFR